MSSFHTPVLLQEVITFLNVQKNERYIDATLGGGGYTFEIVRRGGKVLGIDFDEDAISYVQNELRRKNISLLSKKEERSKNITIYEYPEVMLAFGNFRKIDILAKLASFENVSGIIFDLGVSRHQLESIERGFSFLIDAPLDMRMDKSLGVKAADLIHILTKGELYELFTKLGEERYARSIANSIVRSRGVKKIETTGELVDIIQKAVPQNFSKIHFATRVFQALRIAINDELDNITEALPKAIEILKSGGKLLVVSFHSLEDRIVKNSFTAFEQQGRGRILTKRPIIPSIEETKLNRRSRSSKLRVFEKV